MQELSKEKDWNYFYNPVRVIQGRGCTKQTADLARKLLPEGGRILLLVWNESVFEQKAFRQLREEKDFSVLPMCFQESNPTVEQLYGILEKTEPFGPQVVLAVGGGSTLDVGKSLCCLYGKSITSAEALRIFIEKKQYGPKMAKWIGIPTTAGTGSEVTCWATVWDPKAGVKRSLEDHGNYAYAALVDSSLTESMPLNLAVSSALDAVAHGAESYWAKNSNVVSRALALRAIKLIMGQIDGLLEGNPDAPDRISQGSLLAGMAFSNTKTTACHSISYPLTMEYRIPHGTAVGMLLAPILERNQKKTKDMGALLQAMGVKSSQEVKQRIQEIFEKAGIPSSLSQWQVEYGELFRLAQRGMTKGRVDNNPVELTPVMIEDMLKEIY